MVFNCNPPLSLALRLGACFLCLFIIYFCLSNIVNNIKLWHDNKFPPRWGESERVSESTGLPLQLCQAHHAQVDLGRQDQEYCHSGAGEHGEVSG